MEESRKQFLEWWRHPDQEELRKSCAEGWGYKIWQASRDAIEIELPVGCGGNDDRLKAEVCKEACFNLCLIWCRNAIRAAGIKVKERV